MITNYLFHIINEDFSNYKSLDKQTIKRTKLFGLLMHIPIILWFVLGYFLSQQLFSNVSTAMAILAGMGCSFFIYLIDLAIISDRKISIKKFIFRFLIALIIAFLGALLVDTFIFEKDINRHISKNEEMTINNNFDTKIIAQNALMKSAKSDWLAAEKKAACEATGQCGTKLANRDELKLLLNEKKDISERYVNKRNSALAEYKLETKNCGLFCSQVPIDKKYSKIRDQIETNEHNELVEVNKKINSINDINTSGKSGTGPIYRGLKDLADKLKSKYEYQQQKSISLQADQERRLQNIDHEINNNIGLIEKIKILHIIIFEQPISIIFSALFFIFFLILELILLFTKNGAATTINDHWEDYEEKKVLAKINIAEQRLKDFENASIEGYKGPLLS